MLRLHFSCISSSEAQMKPTHRERNALRVWRLNGAMPLGVTGADRDGLTTP